jgi:hypothetical protein
LAAGLNVEYPYCLGLLSAWQRTRGMGGILLHQGHRQDSANGSDTGISRLVA